MLYRKIKILHQNRPQWIHSIKQAFLQRNEAHAALGDRFREETDGKTTREVRPFREMPVKTIALSGVFGNSRNFFQAGISEKFLPYAR